MAIFTNGIFPSGGEAGNGGGIIQVVTATSTTNSQQVNGTSTWTDMAPTCNITMQDSGYKVLLFLSVGCGMEWVGITAFRALRGSTEIQRTCGYCWNNTRWQYAPPPFQALTDTPGAGTHTYKIQVMTQRNNNFYWNWNGSGTHGGTDSATMTLMEFSS